MSHSNDTTANIPRELRELRQWVAWRYFERPGREKPEKAPCDPSTGRKTDGTDSRVWLEFDEAVELAETAMFDGIGFALTRGDLYVGVDLDGVVDKETGEIAGWASDIVQSFDSYSELSPSGSGIHIVCRGAKPGSRCRRSSVEVYDSRRFLTFTGAVVHAAPIREAQGALTRLYETTFEAPAEHRETTGLTTSRASLDDEALLRKARGAARTGPLFRQLFDSGDHGHFPSASEADLALCSRLAFWTARDAERMTRLFICSARAKSLDRKSEPDGYVERTVARAISECTDVYDPNYRNSSRASRQEVLVEMMSWSLAQPWKRSAKDRDVLRVLMRRAWRYGKLKGNGVEVFMSVADIAVDAGIASFSTVLRSLERLEDSHGCVAKIETGGGAKATQYLLRKRRLSEGEGAQDCNAQTNCVSLCITTLRASSKLRHGIGDLKPRDGQILDLVHGAGSKPITLGDIAAHLQIKRKRDLRNRHLSRLLDRGLLRQDEHGFTTPPDIEDRLNAYLASSGCDAAELAQRRRNFVVREVREAFRKGKALPVVCFEAACSSTSSATARPIVEYVAPSKPTIPTGREIASIWAEGDDHPLTCDCILCSTSAPRFLKPRKTPADKKQEKGLAAA